MQLEDENARTHTNLHSLTHTHMAVPQKMLAYKYAATCTSSHLNAQIRHTNITVCVREDNLRP